MAKLGVGKVKNLVVDEHSPERQNLARMIELMGYEALTSASSEEGFAIWRVEGPRIVIANEAQPLVNGLELCQRISRRRQPLYIYHDSDRPG